MNRYTHAGAWTLVAVCVAFLLSALGPNLDAHDAEKARPHREPSPRERFERAAQAICGDNAAWEEVAPGQIQCFTHRGHKTALVRLGD